VTEDLTRSSSFGSASGALVVEDVNDNAILDNAAYVLASNGKDRKGAYLYQTGALDFGCASGFGEADRLNCDTHDEFFRDAPYNAGEVASTYFDDLIRWAPKFHFVAIDTEAGNALWALQGTDNIISVGSDSNTLTGNVGIGTSTPTSKLHIAGSGTEYLTISRIDNGAQTLLGTEASISRLISRNADNSARALAFRSGTTDVGSFDTSGNFSVTGGLAVGSNIALVPDNYYPSLDLGTNSDAAYISKIRGPKGTDGRVEIWSGPAAVSGATIDLSGRNFDAYKGRIGYVAAVEYEDTLAHWFLRREVSDISYNLAVIRPTGRFTVYDQDDSHSSSTPYCSLTPGTGVSCSSDIRLKEDIAPLTDSLSKIRQLNGVTYRWKSNSNKKKPLQIGFIAQDVQKVFPELVEDDENGYLGILKEALIAPLIEAVKELDTRTTELQKQLNESKKQNTLLQLQLQKLNERIDALENKNTTNTVEEIPRVREIPKIPSSE
jgi:hypothetical protein